MIRKYKNAWKMQLTFPLLECNIPAKECGNSSMSKTKPRRWSRLPGLSYIHAQNGIILQVIQNIGNFLLFIRVQVAVSSKGDVYAFMPQTFGNDKR